MSGEKKILGHWVSYGFSFRRVALGFMVDRYSVSVDLVFAWFTVELK